MIKRLFVLMRQDLIVAWRSHFVTFLLILLAVFVAVFYALPDQVQLGPSLYVYDRAGETARSGAAGAAGAAGAGGGAAGAAAARQEAMKAALEGAGDEVVFVSSRPELEEALRTAKGATGMVIERLGNPPEITMISKGSMPEEMLNIVRAGLSGPAPQEPAGAVPFTVTQLEPERPPLGMADLMIPIGLVFEVLLLGFLFVAVMVFQERQEGSISAYRTSPGGVWTYVLGKVGVWTLLTTAYGIVFGLLTTRFSMSGTQWLQLFLVIVTGGAFMTALGYLISLFFRSISDWFFLGVAVLVLNMLPQISFAMPAFSPRWLSYIPSHPALFATRDIVFGYGGWERVTQPVVLYTALAVALTLVSVGVTRARLFREG